MRIVIDTNVILSGLFWRGALHALIDLVRAGKVELATRPVLLEELAEVIARPKFAAIIEKTTSTPERIARELRMLADVVNAPSLPFPVCRDPDDDAVLAFARMSSMERLCVTSTGCSSAVAFRASRMRTKVSSAQCPLRSKLPSVLLDTPMRAANSSTLTFRWMRRAQAPSLTQISAGIASEKSGKSAPFYWSFLELMRTRPDGIKRRYRIYIASKDVLYNRFF